MLRRPSGRRFCACRFRGRGSVGLARSTPQRPARRSSSSDPGPASTRPRAYRRARRRAGWHALFASTMDQSLVGSAPMMQDIDPKPKRAIVAAVQRPGVGDVEFEASLTELRQLAKTLGFEVAGRVTQKRAGFDAAAYLGKGTRAALPTLRDN